ncbi:MAG TPA: hypothetical protein P5121_34390 [Caldilineaceae bacterium]|nr:hypothetical protein [Caldilineaceae bacterium]
MSSTASPLYWISLLVITATFIGIAVGRFPFLRMNRATIALSGAILLMLLGALPLESAYAALDLNTLIFLLFARFVPNLPNPTQSWLTLAMATTLAGNFTLLGSVVNLIVAEQARQQGIELSFGEYLKAGDPLPLRACYLAFSGYNGGVNRMKSNFLPQQNADLHPE